MTCDPLDRCPYCHGWLTPPVDDDDLYCSLYCSTAAWLRARRGRLWRVRAWAARRRW